MTDNNSDNQAKLAELRQRAETLMAEKASATQLLSPDDTRQLAHELHTWQIELEMQVKELRQTEEELTVSRQKFSDLYDFAPVGYCTANEEGMILEANLTAATLLGVNRSELSRHHLSRFICPEDQDIYHRHRQRLTETGAPHSCELRLLRPGRRPFWVQLHVVPFKDTAGVTLWRVAFLDIDDRKQAENKLSQMTHRHTLILDAATQGILGLDTAGNHVFVNPAAAKMLGYEIDELIGKNGHAIWHHRREDGSHYPDDACEIASAYKDGVTRIVDTEVFWRKDGSSFRVKYKSTPIHEDSRLVGAVVTFEDITDQLEQQNRLAHSQRLEAIGTLAGGIAHDFNNILAAILGYADLAREEVGQQSKAGQDLQEVITAANRAVILVRQILVISRQGQITKQNVEIQYIINEALKLLRPSLSTSIEIKCTIDTKCPPVLADLTEMHQVIMNLCTNAYQAMLEVKKNDHVLAIDLTPVELSEKTRHDLKLTAGRFVKLIVSDTGCGMDAKTMAKIFNPYFTTKAKGKGTGLGLAMVYGIVTGAGGAITVDSHPGQGSTFTVYLPVYENDSPAAEKEETPPLQGGRERIMVIDDDKPIAMLLQRTLAKLGYQVTTPTDCEMALRLFTKQPASFDLVITDMNMPKVMGTDLARALLEIRPDLPVILCTGYSEKVNSQTVKDIGIRAFLYKPVDRENLARVVRKVLDQKAG